MYDRYGYSRGYSTPDEVLDDGFLRAIEQTLSRDVQRLCDIYLPEYRASIRVGLRYEQQDRLLTARVDLVATHVCVQPRLEDKSFLSHVNISDYYYHYVRSGIRGVQSAFFQHLVNNLYAEIVSHIRQLFPSRVHDREDREARNQQEVYQYHQYRQRRWGVNYDYDYDFATGKPNDSKADKKAEKLLLSCLSRQQKKDYKQHGHFFVTGNATNHRYKITKGRVKNIYQVDDSSIPVARHCVESADRVPMGDHLLAQKLLIEANEEEFLRVKIDWDL